LNLTRAQVGDAVERHRQWQGGLDAQTFLDQVFGKEDDQARSGGERA
jgi:hypothetical protein